MIVPTFARIYLAMIFCACLLVSGCKESDPYAGVSVEDMPSAIKIIEYRESNAPALNSKAPDLKVIDRSGKKIELSSFWKEKPAVLAFGSLTCDRTYQGAPEIVKLKTRFGDQYNFVFVYIREAHPADGWMHGEGYSQVVDPKTIEIRKNVADRTRKHYNFNFPVFCDSMDDRAAIAYASWPARLYVIDKTGMIAYRGDPGPWGYRPTEAFQTMPLEDGMIATELLPDPDKSSSLEAFLSRSEQ